MSNELVNGLLFGKSSFPVLLFRKYLCPNIYLKSNAYKQIITDHRNLKFILCLFVTFFTVERIIATAKLIAKNHGRTKAQKIFEISLNYM